MKRFSSRGRVLLQAIFDCSNPGNWIMNAAPGVFEYEVDADGTTHSKVWEWK